MRQRRTDGFRAQDPLAGLARQLRIERQRQSVHDDLLGGHAVEAGRRDGQADSGRCSRLRVGHGEGRSRDVGRGSHGGCGRSLHVGSIELQRLGGIEKEAREGLAQQLIDRQRPHHADTRCIGIHDAPFQHHVERDWKALCRQRVRKIVLHPTLHGEQALGTAQRTDPRVRRSAALHWGRATDGEPAEVGTTYFMMRKSRLQRKPSFCVRCNTRR